MKSQPKWSMQNSQIREHSHRNHSASQERCFLPNKRFFQVFPYSQQIRWWLSWLKNFLVLQVVRLKKLTNLKTREIACNMCFLLKPFLSFDKRVECDLPHKKLLEIPEKKIGRNEEEKFKGPNKRFCFLVAFN